MLNKGYEGKPKGKSVLNFLQNGKWRDFGYGMLAVNINDFKTGFDAKNNLWGMEDVQMYDTIMKQGLYTYRVYDTSIKHIWHLKNVVTSSNVIKSDTSCVLG